MLVAVERNLGRILGILDDYLAWNGEMVVKSLNPPPDDTEKSIIPTTKESSKPKGIRGLLWQVKQFLERCFPERKRRAAKEPEKAPKTDRAAPASPIDNTKPEQQPAEKEPEDENALTSVSEVPNNTAEYPVTEEAPDAAERPEASQHETPSVSNESDQDSVEFEGDQAQAPLKGIPGRAPYHERYYLLFGEKSLNEHGPGRHGEASYSLRLRPQRLGTSPERKRCGGTR